MRHRALLFLLALTPLAACGLDESHPGVVSPVSVGYGSLLDAGTVSLAFGVNGTRVGTPVELQLPPADGCLETTQGSCDWRYGDAAATFNVSQAESLWDWVESILRRESVDVEARVRGPDGDLRRILHRGTLITRLELGSTIEVRWLPQAVQDPGGPQTIEGVKRNPAKLSVTYPLLKQYPVLGATMPVIRPRIVEREDANSGRRLLGYADVEIDELSIEIGVAGFKDAAAYAAAILADGTVDESEFSDVQIEARETDVVTARLQVSAAPVCVKLSDDGKNAVLRLVVRGVRISTATRRARLGPATVKLRPC